MRTMDSLSGHYTTMREISKPAFKMPEITKTASTSYHSAFSAAHDLHGGCLTEVAVIGCHHSRLIGYPSSPQEGAYRGLN
jgi:hypothetical protein